MVVFVAALFLPVTIHFEVPVSENPKSAHFQSTSLLKDLDPARHGSERQTATLFPTPPSEEDLMGENAASDSNPFTVASPPPTRPKTLTRLASISPNEPISPRWGQSGTLTQPSLKAPATPPHVSILRHKASDIIYTARRRRGSRLSTSSSQERIMLASDWYAQPADQGNGGLRNAIMAAKRAGTIDEVAWVGTLGIPTNGIARQRLEDINDRIFHEHDCLTVVVEDSDFDGHYSHFCKTILWPILHYQIPDNPKSKAYQDHSWVYYEKINQAFADKINAGYRKGDVIWIHDYHLMLLPAMIRKKFPEAQIGFFLHVAFPSSEVFRCLANRKQLLEGMLGANLICFQTQEYCQHFIQTCNRLLNVEAMPNGVQLEDRFVDVAAFPIGVDPGLLTDRREDPEVREWLQKLQARYPDKFLIVARDKLDHVRGVRQKLLSYELFLNMYPEYKDKVVMIQVATSATEQAELDATVSDIVTRINSSNSTIAHLPLIYLKQDIGYSQFLAMITVADALMITSLREGMNLTSHEFIFCQDGKYTPKKHGSLILSEFTGSSSIMDGNDLSVNPWDYRRCAEAIHTAITMKAAEKERRWNKLIDYILHHDAEAWCRNILGRLERSWREHAVRDGVSIPRLDTKDLVKQYQASTRRLFILDYEGTLAPVGPPRSAIYSAPQRTIDIVLALVFGKGNIVYVSSSRKPEELDRLFRQLPGLGLIAENGSFWKRAGVSDWTAIADEDEAKKWKASMRTILQYYEERIDRSWVEERHCSMIFHYEDTADKEQAARQAGDCANHINDGCATLGVHAVPGDGCLVVESIKWDKRTACEVIWKDLMKKNAAHKSMTPIPLSPIPPTPVSEEVSRNNSTTSLTGGLISPPRSPNMDEAIDTKIRPISRGNKPEDYLQAGSRRMSSHADHTEMPSFLFVVGDGREDECVFRWANELGGDRNTALHPHIHGLMPAPAVKACYTVSVSKRNTEANKSLSQGVSGVLGALARLPT